MSDRSALMELLIDGYPENLKAASGWTGFTVLLGLLPMLLSIVGFLIADQAQGITTLLGNGEVLMVSNTIVCSAAILLGKDRAPTGKRFRTVPFIQFGTLIVATTSFLYGVVRTLEIIHYSNMKNNLVVWFTAALFLIGCFYALIVVMVDESLENRKNFEDVYGKGDAALEEQFRVAATQAAGTEKAKDEADTVEEA